MSTAYVGLGANIDEPVTRLRQATALLAALPNTSIIQCSAIYRSHPLGPQDQPDFFNACVALSTEFTREGLLTAMQGIEQTMGRVRTRRWGERCIDLDLLLFGSEQCDTPTLQLPHPGIAQRDFVLAPLRELVPGDFEVPGAGDIDTLIEHCCASGVQRTDLSLDCYGEREGSSDAKR